MNRKAKGSGFKMRSGNKTAFKAMGASPAKIDATLVAAAQDLGRSNIPKDNKELVEKQYEGINAYNKAKTQMTADIAKGVIKGAKNYSEGKGAIQNLKNMSKLSKEKKEIEGMEEGDEKKEKMELFEEKAANFRANLFSQSGDSDGKTEKEKRAMKLYEKLMGGDDDENEETD